MSVFDDILNAVPAEDRSVIEKYPQLKASMERLETEHAQASQYAERWVDWQNKNWDPDANMTRAERSLRAELETAQAALEAAQAQGSGANAATIDALRKDFETKLQATQQTFGQTLEGMNQFYEWSLTRQPGHQQEFGEVFDPKKVREFMAQNRINDPDVAYERMYAPKRTELAAAKQKELDAKHAADIEAARQEGYNKRAQEVAMGPGGMLPTDGTGGISGITAPINQPAQLSDEVKAAIAGAKPGDGTLAALGYQMYRSGQLPTQ